MAKEKYECEENEEEIFDEKGILKIANEAYKTQDPDATPKLEKKTSVAQMISNFKSKFGSTAAGKKGNSLNHQIHFASLITFSF